MQLSAVRPPVCPSVPFGRRTSLLQVCCCGPGSQEIDRLLHRRRAGGRSQPPARETANAGSGTLSA